MIALVDHRLLSALPMTSRGRSQSPGPLERLRDRPEIKAALLRFGPAPAAEARFERASKNTAYWEPIERLSARFLALEGAEEVCESHVLYGKPCWLLASKLADSPNAPYIMAVAAADGASVDTMVALLQAVSRDYWYGSYFFK